MTVEYCDIRRWYQSVIPKSSKLAFSFRRWKFGHCSNFFGIYLQGFSSNYLPKIFNLLQYELAFRYIYCFVTD